MKILFKLALTVICLLGALALGLALLAFPPAAIAVGLFLLICYGNGKN
jgi:hypothetical protein